MAYIGLRLCQGGITCHGKVNKRRDLTEISGDHEDVTRYKDPEREGAEKANNGVDHEQ